MKKIREKILKGYVCVNQEKYHRAIFGQAGHGGKLAGGVGEMASLGTKLAAYDKLGGLITKEGRKVKMGSFYDFEKRKRREKPDVKLLFRMPDGTVMELPEGKALPPEVKAVEKYEAIKKKKK